jgi:WD40 repeat protein
LSSAASANNANNLIFPVGDIRLVSRDRIIACPVGSVFLPPSGKKIIRYRTLTDGLVFQTIHTFAPRLESSDKDMYYHEQLHNKKITCVAVCKNGEFIATGSEDLSVRIWQLTKSYGNIRKLVPIHLFVGHDSAITCLDISTEFSLVVSGSKDHSVILWDYRIQCMIRVLANHTGPIVAVSINTISGSILTLTKEQLRIYHLNGDLIGYQNFIDLSVNMHLAPATALIAPPVGEWQEGVIAVTGHKDGTVYLWKMSKKSFINPPAGASPILEDPGSMRGNTSNNNKNTNNSSSSSYSTSSSLKNLEIKQQQIQHPVYYNSCMCPVGGPFYTLYIATVLSKTHKNEITTLRLCSNTFFFTGMNKLTKELINKAYEESRNLDLFVGDADGMVSRWTVAKLDQLPQNELVSLIKHESSFAKN